MVQFKRTIRDFADIAALIAEETATTSNSFTAAFATNLDGFRMGRDESAISTDMPDDTQAQRAVELIIATIFDVLRDTRLEPAAERLAWGVVHSFHRVSDQWAGIADKAAREVQDLLKSVDGSEIHAVELEAAHDALTIFDEATDALACMRDHAALAYAAEAGRPWSAPKATLVSSKRTQAVIEGSDYLAARRQRRIGQHHPEGPLVVFSGGSQWSDPKPIWKALTEMKAVRPTMVLLTTAQSKGADAVAEAWAARTKTPLVKLGIDRARWGNRAGFVRNDQIARLQPVDGIVAEGSGIQAQLVRVLRSVGVQPLLLSLYGGAADWAA
ncbi:SLOG family protein [Sphingomonas oryzagri]